MYRVLGRQSTLLTETEDAAPKAAFSLLSFSYLNVFKNRGNSLRPTICWEESSIARTRMVRSSASRWPMISRCDTPAARAAESCGVNLEESNDCSMGKIGRAH